MIRAAVLYFSDSSRLARVRALADGLAKGLRAQGAQVDVINGTQVRDLKLAMYQYLAVGCDVRSVFKGKLPPELAPLLGNSGSLGGKKAFAFVPSGIIGAETTLLKLMKAMEHEGIQLRFSDVLSKAEEAEGVGKRLKLD